VFSSLSGLSNLSAELELVVVTERLGRLVLGVIAQLLVVVGHFVEDLQVPGDHLLKVLELDAQVLQRGVDTIG